MNKYTVAIIGLGQIGMMYDLKNAESGNILSHAKAFHLHDKFKIVCGVDPSYSARQIFVEEYKCKAFEQIDRCIEEFKPDIVVIATPTKTHLTIIKNILSIHTPRSILCEKPLAYKISEAKEIVDICEAAKCNLFVNYMRRVDSASLNIKKMIDMNNFPSPIKGFCFYSKGLIHNGSHFINLLEFWLGSYQSHIICSKGNFFTDDDSEPDVHVVFEKGSITLQAAWEEEFSHYTIELLSKAGRIRYDQGGYLVTNEGIASDPDFPDYKILSQESLEIPNSMHKSQLEVVISLYNILNNQPSTICTGQEALRTLESIDKILGSLQ